MELRIKSVIFNLFLQISAVYEYKYALVAFYFDI